MHPWFRTTAETLHPPSKKQHCDYLLRGKGKETEGLGKVKPFGDLLSLMAATHISSLQQRLTCCRPVPPIFRVRLAIITAALNWSWCGVFHLFWSSEYAKQGVVQRSLRGRSQLSVLGIILQYCLTGYKKEVEKWRKGVGKGLITTQPKKSHCQGVCTTVQSDMDKAMSVFQKG